MSSLEKEGLITSLAIAQERRPGRRVYTITKSGKQSLNDWLDETIKTVKDQF